MKVHTETHEGMQQMDDDRGDDEDGENLYFPPLSPPRELLSLGQQSV